MELTLTELAYVGIVASVVSQGIRLYVNWRGRELSNSVIAVAILFPASLVMAVIFRGLPDIAGADPMELAQQLVLAATQVLGAATLFYLALGKVILQPVSSVKVRK